MMKQSASGFEAVRIFTSVELCGIVPSEYKGILKANATNRQVIATIEVFEVNDYQEF